LAYSARNAQILYSSHPERLTKVLTTGLSPVFDLDYSEHKFPILPPPSLDTALKLILQRKDATFQRGGVSSTRKAVDTAVDVFSSKAGGWGTLIKVAYPYLKDDVLITRQDNHPNLARDFVIEWATWACNQVREGTATGKALAPYVIKYLEINPKNDLSDHPAVKAGASKLLAAEKLKRADKSKNADERLRELGIDQALLEQAKTFTRDYRESSRKTEAAEIRQSRARRLENTAASLEIIGYALSSKGNVSLARTARNLSDSFAGMAKLTREIHTLSPVMVFSSYIGISYGLASALQGSTEPESPYPKLFELLIEISKQIDDVKIEIVNALGGMDQKLSAKLYRIEYVSNATNYGVEEVRLAIARVQEQLARAKSDLSDQVLDLAGAFFRAEDRECFSLDGSGNFLPAKGDTFFRCRDKYYERATIVAKSTLAPAGTPQSERSQLGLTANIYEELRNKVDPSHGEYKTQLADAGVWYVATNSFLELVQANADRLADITFTSENGFAAQIDPMIAAGVDLAEFVKTVAVKRPNDAYELRSDRFLSLIDEIVGFRSYVLRKVNEQLDNRSINVDPSGQTDQAFDQNYPFQMLGLPLEKCRDATIQLASFDHFHFLLQQKQGAQNNYVERVREGVYERHLSDFNMNLRNVDMRLIGVDKALIRAISRHLVLTEQSDGKKSILMPCLARLVISDFNQSPTATDMNIDVEIRIFLKRRERDLEEAIVPVEVLRGEFHVKDKDFIAANNGGMLLAGHIPRIWNEHVKGKVDEFLKRTSDEKADKVTRSINEELASKILPYRDRLRTLVKSEFSETGKRPLTSRFLLLALSEVGLDQSHPAVQKWLGVLQDDSLFPSTEKVVDDVIGGGTSFAKAVKDLASDAQRLKEEVTVLSHNADLKPGIDVFAGRINELYKLRAARVSIPSSKPIRN
jgi:hypothetical protein